MNEEREREDVGVFCKSRTGAGKCKQDATMSTSEEKFNLQTHQIKCESRVSGGGKNRYHTH